MRLTAPEPRQGLTPTPTGGPAVCAKAPEFCFPRRFEMTRHFRCAALLLLLCSPALSDSPPPFGGVASVNGANGTVTQAQATNYPRFQIVPNSMFPATGQNFWRDSLGNFTTDFTPALHIASWGGISQTYYVDAINGSDTISSHDGSTSAKAFATIGKAIICANAISANNIQITLITGGANNFFGSRNFWTGSFNAATNIYGKRIYITTDNASYYQYIGGQQGGLSWTNDTGYSTYYASRSGVLQVLDFGTVDSYGVPTSEYVNAASLAACRSTAGSWYQSGGSIYVHTLAGTSPVTVQSGGVGGGQQAVYISESDVTSTIGGGGELFIQNIRAVNPNGTFINNAFTVTFTVSGYTNLPSVGSTYTCNNTNYTVVSTNATTNTIICSSGRSATPPASGTLTAYTTTGGGYTGTGDATITYSSFTTTPDYTNTRFTAYGCAFSWNLSVNNCLNINDIMAAQVYNCCATYSENDGFNNHNQQVSGGAYTPTYSPNNMANARSYYSLFFNCVAHDVGIIGGVLVGGSTANGFTSHDARAMMTIGCVGYNTDGPTWATVGGVRAYTYGCRSWDSLAPGGSQAAYYFSTTDSYPGEGLYTYTVSGVTTAPVLNSVYSTGGTSYTVQTVSLVGGAGTITAVGPTAPASSGTLAWVSGTGQASIGFSAASLTLGGLPGYAYLEDSAGWTTNAANTLSSDLDVPDTVTTVVLRNVSARNVVAPTCTCLPADPLSLDVGNLLLGCPKLWVGGLNANNAPQFLIYQGATKQFNFSGGPLIIDSLQMPTAAGVATLSSGSVAVSCPAVTTSSAILLTYKGISATTVGTLHPTSIVAGSGFSITSVGSSADNSTVSWMVVN